MEGKMAAKMGQVAPAELGLSPSARMYSAPRMHPEGFAHSNNQERAGIGSREGMIKRTRIPGSGGSREIVLVREFIKHSRGR